MSENNALMAFRCQEFESPSAPRRDWRGRSSQVAMRDWEMLLRGVQSRLRAIGSAGANGGSHGVASSDRVKADVLECADDLNALQAALTEELGRCKRIERELVDVQAALARSRVELADTRHGELRARHLALHDSLTGLPNRRCFGERLDRALTEVEPAHPGLALLYVDLDGLKAINDRHGHDTGDDLLKIVAARLRAALRAQDVVSRLGGDEFACLLTDLLEPGAARASGLQVVRHRVGADADRRKCAHRAPQHRHRDMPRRWEHGCRAAQARGHRDVLRQARANGLCVLQRTCRGSGHSARADIGADKLECVSDAVRVHARPDGEQVKQRIHHNLHRT